MTTSPEQLPNIVETTDATFEQDVIARSKEVPVVVDFWAEWCGPCRMLGPILEKLADEYAGKFALVKANTEQAQTAAATFGVQSIPAVYAVRGGEVVDFFVGALPEGQIRGWLERILPSPADEKVAEAERLVTDDPAAAETVFRAALDLDTDHVAAKIGLGQLLLEQGRTEESRELLDQLERRGFLESEAEKLKAALDLADKAADAGDLDQCRAAVAAEPDNPEPKLRLAEALAAAGQYEEALESALDLVRNHKTDYGDAAKQVMLDVFQVLPSDSELTSKYRRQLATALY